MQRNVSTTVRVKLHSLTNRKADLLAREYEAFQTEVHGGNAHLSPQPTSRRRKSNAKKTRTPAPNSLSFSATTCSMWPTTRTLFSHRGGSKSPSTTQNGDGGTPFGVPPTSRERMNNSSVRAIFGTANWCAVTMTGTSTSS